MELKMSYLNQMLLISARAYLNTVMFFQITKRYYYDLVLFFFFS